MGNFTRSQFGFFGFASKELTSGVLEEQGDISNIILRLLGTPELLIVPPNVQVSDTTKAQ